MGKLYRSVRPTPTGHRKRRYTAQQYFPTFSSRGKTLIGIVADIHANWAALAAVTEDSPDVTAWWSLGDIVGYGPDPIECVDWAQRICEISIRGNHDQAILIDPPIDQFNDIAIDAITWTRAQLDPRSVKYLADLPIQWVVEPITLVHGSPRNPLDEYISTPEQAYEAMIAIETPMIFVGHSHIQCLWAPEIGFMPGEVDDSGASPWYTLGGGQLLINPGSVGQPRDRDNRAAYLLLDETTMRFQFRRVRYDVERTRQRIHAFGLPSSLADRLAHGI